MIFPSPNARLVAAVLAVCAGPAVPAQEDGPTRMETLAEQLQKSVVKVFGASGLSTISAYASGVVVSDQGHILTADLVMLQRDQTRVVLPDGSTHLARLLPAERDLGVRLMQIDTDAIATPLVPLVPSTDETPPSGTFVVSVGNAFRLAEFDEDLSVTFGVVVGETRTRLRYRLSDVENEGTLILTDATNNPGHYGGALVTLDGKWIGLNTRLVESKETNTQLSAAIPSRELRTYLDRWIRKEGAVAEQPVDDPEPTDEAEVAIDHGIRLFDRGGRRSPPAYIERVRRGSPAADIGLRPDDLIVRIDETPIRSCKEFRRVLERYRPGDSILVTWKRGTRIDRAELKLGEDRR